MLDNQKISVILPCYNEEAGLSDILGLVPDFIDEIIVVDNNSQDKSREVAISYGVRVLVEKKKGYGAALLKGLSQADGQIIVIMDADSSYRADILERLCAYMHKGNLDFVSGCRFPLDGSKSMSGINLLGNYFISMVIRVMFKVDVRDSQSGMMLFRKGILNKIDIYNVGMGFSQEIKIKAWMNPQLNCTEFHIPYYPRIGRVKFRRVRDAMKNLYDLFVLWIKLRYSGKFR
jgi:glycosyltransferase involved in cell wall biosynthesis